MNPNHLRTLAIAALILMFVACWLGGGPGNAIDVTLIREGVSARAASGWPTAAGRFLNIAGGASGTLGLASIAALMMFLRGRRPGAAWFTLTVLGGRLIVEGIKLAVHRARPSFDPHPVLTHSLSFPSAHAANSMIVFPALVLFLTSPQRRAPGLVAAVVASLLVGASRPLLGVHWPSDVVAGWAIGAAWLLVVWPMARDSVSHQPQHDIVGGHGPALGKE